MFDPYQHLGVARTASHAEIKSAFRRLAVQCHPDRDKSDGSAARFRLVVAAWKMLETPEGRRVTDLALAHREVQAPPPPPAPAAPSTTTRARPKRRRRRSAHRSASEAEVAWTCPRCRASLTVRYAVGSERLKLRCPSCSHRFTGLVGSDTLRTETSCVCPHCRQDFVIRYPAHMKELAFDCSKCGRRIGARVA